MKPSCAVMKLTLDHGLRPRRSNASADAARRVASFGELAFVALPERAHGVAELVVPLRPAGREAADLIAARTDVPRLGDQLHRRQHRVLQAALQEAVRRIEAVVLARQDGAEIEAETVDVHLGHPVAQRVGDHLQHVRLLRFSVFPVPVSLM